VKNNPKKAAAPPPPPNPTTWGAFPEQQLNILSGVLKMGFNSVTNVAVAFVHIRWDNNLLAHDVTVWNSPVDVLIRVGDLDVRLNVHGNYCHAQLFAVPGIASLNDHIQISAFGLGTP
jgi:hypothetical protein